MWVELEQTINEFRKKEKEQTTNGRVNYHFGLWKWQILPFWSLEITKFIKNLIVQLISHYGLWCHYWYLTMFERLSWHIYWHVTHHVSVHVCSSLNERGNVTRHICGLTCDVLHVDKRVNTTSQMALSDHCEVRDQID